MTNEIKFLDSGKFHHFTSVKHPEKDLTQLRLYVETPMKIKSEKKILGIFTKTEEEEVGSGGLDRLFAQAKNTERIVEEASKELLQTPCSKENLGVFVWPVTGSPLGMLMFDPVYLMLTPANSIGQGIVEKIICALKAKGVKELDPIESLCAAMEDISGENYKTKVIVIGKEKTKEKTD